jgi:hypothetical protein
MKCPFSAADISSLCPSTTALCSNCLNLSLGEMFHESVSSPERTLGLRRFLYPVYLIDRVEMTPHSSTSPATTDRGESPHYCYWLWLLNISYAVKEFLQSVGITVFLRGDT